MLDELYVLPASSLCAGVPVDDSDLMQVDEFAMRSFLEFDACVKEVCYIFLTSFSL